MDIETYIKIDEKNIYLPIADEHFEIGTLLTDFLELDLTDFQKKVERIKQYNIEDMNNLVKNKGKFQRGYASLLLQINNEMSDREKYVRIAIHNALKDTGHPYAYEVEYSSLNNIGYDKLFEIFDLVKLQKEYKTAVTACLLKQDETDNFSSSERYFNYPNKLKGKAEIVYTISEDFTVNEEYIASDISSLLYLEFMKMLQYNVYVRKCENCGKLFAVKNNHNKKYCDRKIEGTSKTCQEVGATNSFKNKMLKDPIVGEYQRAYKRLYARKRTGKITKDELERQIKKATLLRDRAVAGSLLLKDYIDQITKI